MSITVAERPESPEYRTGTSETYTARYVVSGTPYAADAAAAVRSATPVLLFGRLVRSEIDIKPLADQRWEAEVTYSELKKQDPLDFSYEFSTTGGTEKITQSLATRRYPENAPNMGGVIGYNDGQVEGVQVHMPTMKLTYKVQLAAADVTPGYRAMLFWLTGTTNDRTWNGFNQGEVLFVGATGTIKNLEYWEISYEFLCQPNRTNLVIGNIVVPLKRGWEYLEVLYEDAADQGKAIRKPLAVYVHQVYREADFSLLGIA